MGSEIPEKFFYRIGEVCQITSIQPYVLRFWESEFPQLQPRKNRSGQRLYRREDIDLVLRIKELLYEDEYTIAGARRQLDQEARTRGDRATPETPTDPESEPAPEEARTESASPAKKKTRAAKDERAEDDRLKRVRDELRAILEILEREPGQGG